MARSNPTRAAGDALLRDSTAVANAFVQAYVGRRDGRAAGRHVPQDTYQLALDTTESLGNALIEDLREVDIPASRGARAALRGKHMSHSLDWIGQLERVVTNHLFTDAGLEPGSAKAGVVRLGLLFDSIYRQELDAYRVMEERLSGWQSRVGTGLVTYLLSGAPIEPSALVEQARMLGIDPNQPYRAVALCHRDRATVSEECWAKARGRILDTVWRHDERREVLVLDRHGVLLALVPEDRPGAGVVAMLDKTLRDRDLAGELFVTYSEPAETLLAAGDGLRRAVAALDICAHRSFLGRITPDSDVTLDLLLAENEPVARALVTSTVACLVDRPALLDTLRAYISADLALQRTAEALHVHPNTVVYRLRQIAELTGRDMRSISALIALSNGLTALEVLDLHTGPGGPDDDLRTVLLTGP